MAELDKFYTNKNIAKKCVDLLHTFFTVDSNEVYLEPTAGDGAFLDYLPNYEAYDLKPEDSRVSPSMTRSSKARTPSCSATKIRSPRPR